MYQLWLWHKPTPTGFLLSLRRGEVLLDAAKGYLTCLGRGGFLRAIRFITTESHHLHRCRHQPIDYCFNLIAIAYAIILCYRSLVHLVDGKPNY